MPNKYANARRDDCYSEAFAITNHDTNIVTENRGLYVVTGGTLTVRAQDSQVDVSLGTVTAGQVIRISVKLVKATGTTAVVLGLV